MRSNVLCSETDAYVYRTHCTDIVRLLLDHVLNVKIIIV
jgi:hypothetical protein